MLTSHTVFDLRQVEAMTGRSITADDVEPLTWVYYERGLDVSAASYLEAVNDMHRRGVAGSRCGGSIPSHGGDGFDLLLTPTMPEPPAEIGDVVGTKEDPWHGRFAPRRLPRTRRRST